MATSKPLTGKQRFAKWAYLTALFAIVAGVVLGSIFERQTLTCHQRWQQSPARAYQPYAEYEHNVCDGKNLPTPVDPNVLP